MNIGIDDYWIVKLDSSGNVEWNNLFGGPSSERSSSVQQTNDGGYIIAGFTSSSLSGDVTDINNGINSTSDYWIIKLDANGMIEEG